MRDSVTAALRMRSVLTRREVLEQAWLSFGTLALTQLLARDHVALAQPPASNQPGGMDLRPRPGHFPAQAKAAIMLMQTGGPSHVDLFDPKPELTKHSGQKHPEQVESFQPGSQDNLLLGSPFKFEKRGQCGMEISELLPHMGKVADDLCMVRSMVSENNNHPQAARCLNTGKVFPGRPTLGAWVSYALGTENENLPAFVVLRDPGGYANGGTMLWENGWLPAVFRGTEFQSRGSAVLNLHPAMPAPVGVQETNLVALAQLNEERRKLYPQEIELDSRIRNYELAARMQLRAEPLLDLAGETEETKHCYGLDNPVCSNYATRCLLARRLVEAGVRFVLVTVPVKSSGMPWDQHDNLKPGLEAICPQVDQPSAALIKDLKARGMLDSTLVLWSGEFGRLPISQHGSGRDHNRHAFTTLLAGAGFKPGFVYGATDEFGYRSVENKVKCPDLLATILHQLGLDHRLLAYAHHGRSETMTDPVVTDARVVAELLRSPLPGTPAAAITV